MLTDDWHRKGSKVHGQFADMPTCRVTNLPTKK